MDPGLDALDKPFDIELEYVQRMMAWLLFVEPADRAKRHAMQLGLGAGSLTKFCHKAAHEDHGIELNPQVVAACRLWFKLPPDDARLSVILGDAAEVAAHEHWRGASTRCRSTSTTTKPPRPVLDSEAFYADCRKLLTEDGCMTVNLFGRSSSYAPEPEEDPAAFGAGCGLGIQADARGQHDRAGFARAPAAHPGRACRPRGNHRDSLGPAGRQVAAGVQAC